MNVVLLTAGSRGDVQPFVALATELQRGGHRVVLAAPADAEALVTEHGVPFASLGVDYQALLQDAKTRGAVSGSSAAILRALREVKGQMRSLLDRAWEASRDADAVVCHPKALAGAHIAEALAVPCWLAAPAPFLVPTREFAAPIGPLPDLGRLNRASYRLARLAALPFGGILNRWRRETLGLPALPRLADPLTAGGEPLPVLYAFSEVLVPRAADWPEQVQVTGFWLLDPGRAGYEPPDTVRAFLDAGEPPVYVGFGSMTGGSPERTIRIVLEAVRRAGVRAVLSIAGGGPRPGEVPGEVLLVESIPHDWLFPRCSAVVHHGGSGTTATGLRAGRPTVVCPFFGDQPFWGERVHAVGAGPEPIPQKALRADRLAEAIRVAAREPGMREQAERIGTRLREESGARTAARLVAGAAGETVRAID